MCPALNMVHPILELVTAKPVEGDTPWKAGRMFLVAQSGGLGETALARGNELV